MKKLQELLKNNETLLKAFLALEAAANHCSTVMDEEYYAQGYIEGYYLGRNCSRWEDK